jgi:hypothetical protein
MEKQNELRTKAIDYLNTYYTKENISSMDKQLKFYMLEPNSINGIAQGMCKKENWLDMNNKRANNQNRVGCMVDIEYTDLSNNIVKRPQYIYFSSTKDIWNRRGNEMLSKIFGNSSISSTSARRVKLGGKKKKNRKTKKRT